MPNKLNKMKTLISAFLLFFFTATLLFSQISTVEQSVNKVKKFASAKADPKTKSSTEKIFCFPFGGYSNVPTGPSYFYLSDPNNIYLIDSSATPIYAATWANGKWYGADYGAMTLLTIDTASGAMTTIGNMGVVLNGLAYDTVSNILYGVSSTGLYSIDITSGALTLIGESNLTSPTYINLACSPSGKLYTVNMNDDILYLLDKTTGAATAVGTGLGILISFAQDMEYDFNSNTLYIAGYMGGGSSGLFAVDTLTGTVSASLGNLDSAEVCGMAIPINSTTSYSVAFSVVNGHGTLSATVNGLPINSGDIVNAGETVDFAALPDSLYIVKEWINNASIVSGNTTENYSISGLSDNVVVTVEFVSTASFSDYEKMAIAVFPNPATDFLTIPVESSSVLNVWSAAGTLILTKTVEAGNKTIDVSGFAAGKYYIMLSGEKNQHAVFVIE
ncbi:MAG: hypothetical protein A2W93_10535 [Bacteroidetes bacterium GWF2_43_63]|nr:MAG: hypothetical protein A2W93_10535 [Bacteroidetes bacterium GWF2_43_63]